MNREKMLELLKAGKKPIDVAILKWEECLEGIGNKGNARNCALCYIYEACPLCLLDTYGFDEFDYKHMGCGGFFDIQHMTYEAKQCMLQMLYNTKALMIEDGVY